MTATVTITPTLQPTNSPPRVSLAVSAAGTPTLSTVTISRTDPDGTTKLVRTTDGNPLSLTAGAARTVTDGVTTASSTTVTSATAAFVSADVGAGISGGSIPAGATISSVTSATAVVISAAATASATAVSVTVTRPATGTLYDYEIPYGVAVTYSAAEGNAPKVNTQLNTGAVWLVHLAVSSRSFRVLHFRRGSFDNETWAINQGVFPILGRAAPIVVTGAARTAPASSMTVGINSTSDLTALRNLLSDGSALLLNVDPSLSWGVDTNYIAAGTVTNTRTFELLPFPERGLKIDYQVVARPVGGTKAAVAWSDVAAKYAAWSSIPAGTTWAQLATGP